jgi:GNAT superfamily N-acetyltransferase
LTATGWPGLRPAGPDDGELLYRIYASTREAELAVTGWDASVKEAFLRMQFAAQDSHYHATFPAASYDLIVGLASHDEATGKPAGETGGTAKDEVLGRLYVDRGAEAWLVLDLALLPEHQRKGIGTCLLTRVRTEAAAAGRPVRLHVERFNQARRLYQRLGFTQVADDGGVYLLLEWQPPEG